jgi:RNA polymerase-binding transcription factor DksA
MGQVIIPRKSKLKQFFCRHKNTGWYQKDSNLLIISGETHYHVCHDCGKEIDRRFLAYEGRGFK